MEDQALDLLGRHRHSFLNHLQVISGWLQLQKPEKALEYLNRVAARMETDGQAIRSVPPALGLAVLDLAMQAESLDVRIEWRLAAPLPEIAPQRFRETVALALEESAAHGEGRRTVVVSCGPGGLTVHSPVIPSGT